MGELGELLRKAREEKGLSLAQVEEATRIRSAYLQALEEEAYERLPAPVYVRGFLRNYAVYLGLDPQQVVASYQAPDAPPVMAPTSLALDEPLRPLHVRLRQLWPVGLGLLVVALVVAGWWALPRYGDRFNLSWPFTRPTAVATPTPTVTPTLAPPTATPVPPTPTQLPTHTAQSTNTPAPALTPTAVTSLELRVEVVNERAWLLVEVDGQPLFAGILEPGATDTWVARERIAVRCGNAGAVRITLNGQSLGLLGEIGQVVDREWTVAGVPTRTPAVTATPTP